MYPGLDIAVVITNRSGRPLLMQLRNIDARTATTSARQAASTILEHVKLQATGMFDYDGTGDLPLDPKTGKVYVMNRRYAVLYRQVQALYVMAVVYTSANLYAVADLNHNIQKLLIGILAQKQHPVDPERLARKYGEVYAALEEMVQGSLAGEAATAEPVVTAKRKDDSKKKFKFSLSSKKHKVEVEEPLKTINIRTLADNASSFDVQPPGYRAPEPVQQRYVQPADFAVQPKKEEPAKPAVPAVAAPAADPFAAMNFDDLTIPAGVSGMGGQQLDPFGNAVAANAQPTDPLAVLAAQMSRPGSQLSNTSVPGGMTLGAAAREAAALPVGPPDMKEGGLYLVEVWKGVVVGGKLVRAGVEGVVMEKMLPDNPESQVFRINAEGLPTSTLLPLTAVGVDRFQVEKYDSARGLYKATLGARTTQGGSHQFARYCLPPFAAICPLAARIFLVKGTTSISKQNYVLVLEYRASPKLTAPLTGVVMDIEVPTRLGMPGRVKPRGDWSALKRIMRFTRTSLKPGERGACRIAFSADLAGGPVNQQAIRALAYFSGSEKATLSGIKLESGASPDNLVAAYAVFHGELELRPAAPKPPASEPKPAEVAMADAKAATPPAVASVEAANPAEATAA